MTNRVLLPILFALALAACRDKSAPPPPPAAQPAPAPVETAQVLGPSIYDLPITLTTSMGAQVGLDVSKGHPVLVSMFYASCTTACPLLLSEVIQTVDQLPPDQQRDIRVVLVSFDGARDTPDKLATLARERHLDDRFTVAAANDADARALAAVLGFKYRRMPDGAFAHGISILALDREGRPIARVDQLGQRDVLLHALATLPPITSMR
jgi:protein SCO1/2